MSGTGKILYSTVRDLGTCGSKKYKKWGEILPDTRVAIGAIYGPDFDIKAYGNYSVEQAQLIVEGYYKAGKVCNDGFVILPVGSPEVHSI